MSQTKNLDCFVIMPFSETTPEHTEQYWTNHYECFLRPTIEEIDGINVHRSTPVRGDLIRIIITSLVKTDIVLADLTDKNPNVYWELGVRQSFKHGTIVILEDGQKLPFDVSPKAYHKYYPKDHVKNERFKVDIKNAVKDIIEFPKKADSHVLETLDGRGTIYEIIAKEDKKRKLVALRQEIEMNSEFFKLIKSMVQNNVSNQKLDFPLVGIETQAIEQLNINRYLEQEEINYSDVLSYITYSRQLKIYIEKLRLNPTSSFGFNSLLQGYKDNYLVVSRSLIREIINTQQKLQNAY